MQEIQLFQNGGGVVLGGRVSLIETYAPKDLRLDALSFINLFAEKDRERQRGECACVLCVRDPLELGVHELPAMGAGNRIRVP